MCKAFSFALIVAALVIPMQAAQCTRREPCVMSTNFSADIAGVADTRPQTWGTAGVEVWRIRFSPPAGHHVRIVRAQGDLVAWVRSQVEPSRKAGVLLGLQTTAPEGSVRCDWCADNTFLYIQDALAGNEARRAPFDHRVPNVALGADHVMVVKAAAWLNDTGQSVHLEPTLTITYFWERSVE